MPDVCGYETCQYCGCVNAFSDLNYPNRSEKSCPGCGFSYIYTLYDHEVAELRNDFQYKEIQSHTFLRKPHVQGDDVDVDVVESRGLHVD